METQYGLFFSRGTTVIRLPFNPEKLPVQRDTDNGTYNVLGVGPIMVPRTPELRVIPISGLLPGQPFSGVLTPQEFQSPEFYIRFFNEAMDDRAPLQFIPVRYMEDGTPFMGGAQNVGLTVLVTSFTYEERGGETGDFYYDLTLTEYRDYAPRVLRLQRQDGAQNVATAERPRSVPQGQLVTGALCVANGPCCYSSYGDSPRAALSGRTVRVSRMVDAARPYPIHVTTERGGALGWMAAAALQVVSAT